MRILPVDLTSFRSSVFNEEPETSMWLKVSEKTGKHGIVAPVRRPHGGFLTE